MQATTTFNDLIMRPPFGCAQTSNRGCIKQHAAAHHGPAPFAVGKQPAHRIVHVLKKRDLGAHMIRKLAAAALLASAVLVSAAPALAQPPELPPEIQEMIDKVHLGTTGELIAVEDVPKVFKRLPSGDLSHLPSGFVCQHTYESLNGLMPGFVTIFDDPEVGDDIGCGMIARGVNISLFVFAMEGSPEELIGEYASGHKRDTPPKRGARKLAAATAEELGLAPGTPFASDIWTDTDGQVQVVYLAKLDRWFVSGRLTVDPAMLGEGNSHIGRQFQLAQQTIRQ